MDRAGYDSWSEWALTGITITDDTKIRDTNLSLFLFQQQSRSSSNLIFFVLGWLVCAVRCMHLDLSVFYPYCVYTAGLIQGFRGYIMVVSLSLSSSLNRPGFLFWTAVLEPAVHIVALGEIGNSPTTSGFAFSYPSFNAVCSFGCRPLDGHCFVRGLSST